MVKIEEHIKRNAPGSLYGEWAKKEECWLQIRQQDFDVSLHELADELDGEASDNRRKLTEKDVQTAEIQTSLDRLKSLHPETWKKIEEWGRETEKLTQYQRDVANTIANRLRAQRELSESERQQGEKILDIADKYPHLFVDMEDFFLEDESEVIAGMDITMDLIREIADWDRSNRILKPEQHRFLEYLVNGRLKMTGKYKYIAARLYKKARNNGFAEAFASEEA